MSEVRSRNSSTVIGFLALAIIALGIVVLNRSTFKHLPDARGSTSSRIQSPSDGFPSKLPTPLELLVAVIVGIIYVVFSFPLGLTKMGRSQDWQLLIDAGDWSRSVIASLAGNTLAVQATSYHTLLNYIVIALAVYNFALLVLALRHSRISLFTMGVGFLVLGTASLHVLTWTM